MQQTTNTTEHDDGDNGHISAHPETESDTPSLVGRLGRGIANALRSLLSKSTKKSEPEESEQQKAIAREEAYFRQPNPSAIARSSEMESIDPWENPLPIVRRFKDHIQFEHKFSNIAAVMSQIAFERIAEKVIASEKHPRERYRVTKLFVDVMLEHGPESEIGQAMIKKINTIHHEIGIAARDYPHEFNQVIPTCN